MLSLSVSLLSDVISSQYVTPTHAPPLRACTETRRRVCNCNGVQGHEGNDPISEEGHKMGTYESITWRRLVHCTAGPKQLFQSVSLDCGNDTREMISRPF